MIENDMVTASVIIPMYNAGDTINRTIESVFLQEFDDFEIVLVDDGSFNIGESYFYKFLQNSRVTLIHKLNGGVGDARNIGLKFATGKYIFFLDADDIYDELFLPKMIDHMGKGTDIVVCNVNIVDIDGNRTIRRHLFGDCMLKEKKSIFENCILPLLTTDGGKATLLQNVWNKCYLRQRINEANIFFEEKLSYAEDWLFNILYFNSIERCSFISDVLYYYIHQNESSLSCSVRKNYIDENILINRKLNNYFSDIVKLFGKGRLSEKSQQLS